MVPSGWKHGQVKDFFLLQRGFDLTREQSTQGDIPVYSSSGISYFHNESKVKGPGIVTGRKGSVGPVYFIEEDFWPHDTTLWVKDFKDNNIKYIKYFLTYLRLERFDEASSVPTLNRNNVHGIKCVFPPNKEQQKIAHILSTWDKAIEKLEALIAAKQKRKEALIQQILTGKKRFAGFEGEWETTRLMNLLKEEKTKNKDCSVLRVLSVTNHSGFVLPEEQFSRQVASSDLSNYKIVRKGQFGYNPSRINVGSFARLDSYEVGVLSPMYIVFSIDERKLNSDFFLNWMSSHEAKQRIISSTQGSVRDSVGFDALSSFHIKLPAIEEQKKIASVLSVANTEITTNRKHLSALKEQKKGLMQQLLTGKKRVKVDSHV
jgi:type I restriction enzyme S subunit